MTVAAEPDCSNAAMSNPGTHSVRSYFELATDLVWGEKFISRHGTTPICGLPKYPRSGIAAGFALLGLWINFFGGFIA
jgi:hypothetical protein